MILSLEATSLKFNKYARLQFRENRSKSITLTTRNDPFKMRKKTKVPTFYSI